MFIGTERTPNPATLKFLPGRAVMEQGTAEFTDADSASASPLAEALIAVDGVRGVFFGGDFITVTKTDDADWPALKTELLGIIMQHFTAGLPLFRDGAGAAVSGSDEMAGSDADREIIDQIKAILEEKVRPAVARDGGDITYHGFTEGVVYLHMKGACAGCPSSTATLKQGIENMLRYYIPEVREVRASA